MASKAVQELPHLSAKSSLVSQSLESPIGRTAIFCRSSYTLSKKNPPERLCVEDVPGLSYSPFRLAVLCVVLFCFELKAEKKTK